MRRFYLPPEQCRKDVLVLAGPEAHHAQHVLRLRRGNAVTVLNGVGDIYSCEMTNATRSTVELAVLDHRTVPPLPWQITLFQAIPKGKLFDAIVEKATELGAHRIVPIISERVVSIPANEEQKLEKWKSTAIEAIKQCGSPWLPTIEAPVKLTEVAKSPASFDLHFLTSLQPNAQHPRHWLDRFEFRSGQKLTVGIWVGPEGDFSPAEVALLEAAGARPLTLGPLVLRAETAAIYCLSVLGYEMQWRLQPPPTRA
jgi:16S rRNA (uracil1498-N3)-methyltransferase